MEKSATTAAPTLYATIGQALKAMRVRRKLNLNTIARRTGISHQALTYLEDGRGDRLVRSPGLDHVQRYCLALGVKIDTVLKQVEPPTMGDVKAPNITPFQHAQAV